MGIGVILEKGGRDAAQRGHLAVAEGELFQDFPSVEVGEETEGFPGMFGPGRDGDGVGLGQAPTGRGLHPSIHRNGSTHVARARDGGERR